MQASVGFKWAGKRVLIVGLARSGLAAAELLLKAGAVPLLFDEKPLEKLSAKEHIIRLAQAGCEKGMGSDPFALLADCDAVVVSPAVPVQADLVRRAKEMNLPVVGELELGSLFAKGPIFAVTGTNGKTTTVSLLGEMFRAAGKRTVVCGNIGHPITSAVMELEPGDPLLAEVSSFQMETADTFRPCVAAITNITPDHLDRHGTMDAYIACKRRIFSKQTPSDYAVLNADDERIVALAPGLQAQKLWFSTRENARKGAIIQGDDIILRVGGSDRFVCKTEDILLPGKHNLENALAAVVMAAVAGIPLDSIRQALARFGGVEHRIEFVRTIDGISFINDSKGTNPESTLKALEAMNRPTILLAGGYDKKVSFSGLAEAILKNPMITNVVTYGETSRQIEQSLLEVNYLKVAAAPDMFAAIDAARSIKTFEEGNILLSPACASFDQFDDYEQRGILFKRYVMSLSGESHE